MADSKSKINCFLISAEEFSNNHQLQILLVEEGSVFQQIEFLTALGHSLEFIVAFQNDKISGVLPLVANRKMGYKAYHKPPYAHIYGPLIAKSFIHEANVIISELLKNINNLSLVEFKLPISNNDTLPYIIAGGRILATQTHVISNDTNYNYDKIHSSKRRYLKKLKQELDHGNLILSEGVACNDAILELQKQVAQKNGFRDYLTTLKKIMANLKEDQAYSLLISTPSGEPLAGAYCPFDKHTAYHLINASVRHTDNKLKRANILSTYLAVSKAMEKGLNFDFEGSNIPGVASFYRMMGGEPSIHYRIQIPRNMGGRAYLMLRNF